MSSEFYKNKEYNLVLKILNQYLNKNLPLSLTKNISGKRFIDHPYYSKVTDILMCKRIFSTNPNFSKTLRRIKYKEHKPFLKYIQSRKSKRNINSSILVNPSKKYKNIKSEIEFNGLKENKQTKRNIKKSVNNYLKIKNKIVVENVTNNI